MTLPSHKVSHAAFVLRMGETGLSVLKAVRCSREVCDAGQRVCFGEFVLETIQVRELGVRVVDDDPDAADFSENHAEIVDLPFSPATDEERRLAEDLATDLANLSSLHYDRYDNYL